MTSKTAISDDDAELFRSAVGQVRKINANLAPNTALPPKTVPTQTYRDDQQVMTELLKPLPESLDPDAAEPLRYLKDGLNPRLLLKLGRGQFSVLDEIDLHQMTAEIARRVIHDFIDNAIATNKFCVKIITGKGMRSKSDGPVLKRLTDKILRQRKDVLAFRSARYNDGGSGAVIVLLQKRR